MKRNRIPRAVRVATYLILFGGIMTASVFLGTPQFVSGNVECCTYGVDCPTGGGEIEIEQNCCVPIVNQADCSQSKRNYCKAQSCS